MEGGLALVSGNFFPPLCYKCLVMFKAKSASLVRKQKGWKLILRRRNTKSVSLVGRTSSSTTEGAIKSKSRSRPRWRSLQVRLSPSLASRLFKRIYLKNNSLKMLPSSSQRGKRGEFGTRPPPPTNRYFLSASGAALLSRLTSPFWTVLSEFIWPRIGIRGGKQHLPRQRPQYSGWRDKANTNPLVKPSRSRLQRGGSGGTLVSVFTTPSSPTTPVTPPPPLRLNKAGDCCAVPLTPQIIERLS